MESGSSGTRPRGTMRGDTLPAARRRTRTASARLWACLFSAIFAAGLFLAASRKTGFRRPFFVDLQVTELVCHNRMRCLWSRKVCHSRTQGPQSPQSLMSLQQSPLCLRSAVLHPQGNGRAGVMLSTTVTDAVKSTKNTVATMKSTAALETPRPP